MLYWYNIVWKVITTGKEIYITQKKYFLADKKGKVQVPLQYWAWQILGLFLQWLSRGCGWKRNVRGIQIRQILLYSTATPPPSPLGPAWSSAVSSSWLSGWSQSLGSSQITSLYLSKLTPQISDYDGTLSRTFRIWIAFKFWRFFYMKWKKT